MTPSPEVSAAHLAAGVQDHDGAVAGSNGQLLSLLFPRGAGPQSQVEEPGYFRDLNLDQMVAVMFEGHDDPGRLAALFYVQAGGADVVKYRQDIFRDLEDPVLRCAVGCFRERIDQVRRHVAGLEKRHDRWQRQAWFLDAAVIYCEAVVGLDEGLRQAPIRSAGLAALRDVIGGYRNGAGFSNLSSDAQKVRAGLSAINYGVRVRGATVEVSRYQDQGDYSEEIEDTFRRFRQGDVTDYSIAYR